MTDIDVPIENDALLNDPVLQVIPEMDRIMIRMRAFGMSTEEIAMVAGIGPDDVEDRLSRIDKNISEFKSFLA